MKLSHLCLLVFFLPIKTFQFAEQNISIENFSKWWVVTLVFVCLPNVAEKMTLRHLFGDVAFDVFDVDNVNGISVSQMH